MTQPEKIASAAPPKQDVRTPVVLTGIDVPFGDLVAFYFKAVFAAVPAGIVVTIIVAILHAIAT